MNGKLNRGKLWLLLLVPTTVLLCTCIGVAQVQQANERLILKDGSYQSVVKYELQGDRVHYLSAERYEYEDIPASLIDWDATKKYNEDLSANKLRTHVVETPEEKEAEAAKDKAYKESLKKIPDAKAPADPWGTVRSDAPKAPAAKSASSATKPKAKTGSNAN